MNIQINRLGKKYGEQWALDINQLSISKGELVGIVGNNGAGKTTLFRLLLDLTEPSQGEAVLSGQQITEHQEWKLQTGSYLDENFLIDFLKPEEYFYFTGQLYGMDKEAVDKALAAFSDFAAGEIMGKNKYIRQFSSGNKQKIGIIASMIVKPSLLILDEPFNYLDPSSQIMMKRMLTECNESHHTTILISSHNLSHIKEICSRIILLERGKVLLDLTPSENDLLAMENYFS